MSSEQDLLTHLNTTTPAALDNGPDWWRLLLSLLLVLGLAIWVLRQLRPWLQAQKGLVNAVPPDQRIVVHHAVRLGGGNALHTVSVGEQTWLVGTGPSGSPRVIAPITSSRLT